MADQTKAYRYFASILGVDPIILQKTDEAMVQKLGRTGVLSELMEKNEVAIERMLFSVPKAQRNASSVQNVLRNYIKEDESELLKLLSTVEGANDFERAAYLARTMASPGKGFFLRKEIAENIFRARPPKNLLAHFGFSNVEELIDKVDVSEAFSALRFIETDEWMHETFDVVYSGFDPSHFEERAIEIKVLGKEWESVARKFVEKKHHNVSHLKEFGVIFLNPVREDSPGKFLRDFALLLHYFHEIAFYSKLFRYYAGRPDFPKHFKALLRGDIREATDAKSATDWLIVQRYLWKLDPKDPRLFLPRINPESLHWHRGEDDLTSYKSEKEKSFDLKIWNDEDWVGQIFDGRLLSFDIEDNVMSFVSYNEGRHDEIFTYHQREALWTKIFSEYVGGEDAMERLLIENFESGIVKI